MEVLDRAGVKYLIKKISEKFSGSIKKVTYAELKTLRDNSQLTPGQQYRIIDYITTTNQENTLAAGHQFDIIVTANDNKTLNEKAKAIQHDGTSYFANNDLNAWQIWYCLDNDGDRFAWGGIASEKIKSTSSPTEQTFTFDKTISYILFENKKYVLNIGEEVSIYSGMRLYVTLLKDGQSLRVRDNDSFISSSRPITVHFSYSGTGVIYRMIDEFGNDCPYDFKNIRFRHPIDAEDVSYYYTFSLYKYGNTNYTDASLLFSDSDTSSVLDSKPMCYNNIINSYIVDKSYRLPNNICITQNNTSVYNNRFGTNCRNNFLGIACNNNSFGYGSHDNHLTDNCGGNSFGSGCYDNILDSSDGNSFGYSCYNHNLYYSDYNSFGEQCGNNILDSSSNNTFGNSCSRNSLGKNCNYNYFKENFDYGVFGSSCSRNSFGRNCSKIVFGDVCCDNVFGNDCYEISFRSDYSTSATPLNYCYHNHFHDQCRYMIIWNNTQPTTSNQLKNINVIGEVRGTSSSYESINITDLNASYEIKVAKNSKGEIKIYCEADLIA